MLVFLCDGQGTDRQAILSSDRSCLVMYQLKQCIDRVSDKLRFTGHFNVYFLTVQLLHLL